MHVAAARGSRRSPELQMLLPTPEDAEAPTESAVTSSESSALEEDPPTGQQTPEEILYVTNVLSEVVHVARLTFRGRCRWTRVMLHDPAAGATRADTLSVQGLPGGHPDRGESSGNSCNRCCEALNAVRSEDPTWVRSCTRRWRFPRDLTR